MLDEYCIITKEVNRITRAGDKAVTFCFSETTNQVVITTTEEC